MHLKVTYHVSSVVSYVPQVTSHMCCVCCKGDCVPRKLEVSARWSNILQRTEARMVNNPHLTDTLQPHVVVIRDLDRACNGCVWVELFRLWPSRCCHWCWRRTVWQGSPDTMLLSRRCKTSRKSSGRCHLRLTRPPRAFFCFG